jgi:hypothetical protein
MHQDGNVSKCVNEQAMKRCNYRVIVMSGGNKIYHGPVCYTENKNS